MNVQNDVALARYYGETLNNDLWTFATTAVSRSISNVEAATGLAVSKENKDEVRIDNDR
jgi:hypothetical protein